MEFKHKSVLLKETIEQSECEAGLASMLTELWEGQDMPRKYANYYLPRGRLIGIDQDDAAIQAASERLRDYQDRTMIIRSNYCHMVLELKKGNQLC